MINATKMKQQIRDRVQAMIKEEGPHYVIGYLESTLLTQVVPNMNEDLVRQLQVLFKLEGYIMTQLQVLIRNACEEHDVEFRNDYSGRGMYGDTCIGAVSNFSSVMQVIGSVIKELTAVVIDEAFDAESDEERAAAISNQRELQRTIDAIMDFKTDSMGYSTIVYWPDLAPM